MFQKILSWVKIALALLETLRRNKSVIEEVKRDVELLGKKSADAKPAEPVAAVVDDDATPVPKAPEDKRVL